MCRQDRRIPRHLSQRRVIAADRKYTKPAQEIEIAHAFAVEEVLALPLLETHIVADCLEDADQLLVEMARVHGTALRLALYEHLGNVKIQT